MYRHNSIGPWPIIDLGDARGTRSDTVEYTAHGAALNILLDTQNLGSKSEAFISNSMSTDPAPSFLNENCAFGVLLQPLENYDVSDTPIFIDININANWDKTDTSTDSNAGQAIPFIGLIDTGTTPADGWDATNNKATKYHCIAGNLADNFLNVNTQVLLKDIVSGSIPNDLFICVGFYLRGIGQTFKDLDYTISARYALASVKTLDKDG